MPDHSTKHLLNSPLIESCFVYRFKPLSGVLNGVTTWLLLERDTVPVDGEEVVGGSEYAGGVSSVSGAEGSYVT